MSTNVGKDGPWYTSKRMWTLGITGLCIALRWAGVNVPYTSEELTGIIYPVVEAAGVALAAWWTLRADRKLTGLPGITAGDSGPEKPANLDDPGRHFSYLWLMVPLAALGLSGCMGLGPYADPRTNYRTTGSQQLQCDELEVNINLPEGYSGPAPTIALFGQGAYAENSTYRLDTQADAAYDLASQWDSAQAQQTRTGQQTVGSGQGTATGTGTQTSTPTTTTTVDFRPAAAVTGQGLSQAQAQPATSTQQAVPLDPPAPAP